MARRVDEVGVPVVGDGQSQTDRNGMVNVNLYFCANKRRAHIGGIRTNANSEEGKGAREKHPAIIHQSSLVYFRRIDVFNPCGRCADDVIEILD